MCVCVGVWVQKSSEPLCCDTAQVSNPALHVCVFPYENENHQ